MKISVPNELFFTVFFGKENASKRMRDIFEEFYGDIGKAFTGIEPKTMYNSEPKENTIYKDKPQENAITWN